MIPGQVVRLAGHVLRDLGRFALANVIPISMNLAVLPALAVPDVPKPEIHHPGQTSISHGEMISAGIVSVVFYSIFLLAVKGTDRVQFLTNPIELCIERYFLVDGDSDFV